MRKIILCLFATLSLFELRAQKELFLLTPDARSLGMGGVVLTDVAGSHALFNNPSASAFAPYKMQLSGSYLDLDDSSYAAISGFYNFDTKNIVQAGWRRLSHTERADMTFDVGYTRRLSEKWSLGFTLATLWQTYHNPEDFVWLPHHTDNALWADVGFLFVEPLNLGRASSFRLAGKIGGIGGYIGRGGSLPTNASLGASFDTFISDAHQVTLGVEGATFFPGGMFDEYSVAVGLEYNLMQLVQVRGGYHHFGHYVESSYASVGAGVRFLHIRLDFAYLFFRGSHTPDTWSLSAGFDF